MSPTRILFPVLLGLGCVCAEIKVLTPDEPKVNTGLPDGGGLTHLTSLDTLNLAVAVTSTYEVKTVKASIGDRETTLQFATPYFRGKLPLKGMDAGARPLTIIAEDVFSDSGTFSMSVTYAPESGTREVLTVTKPRNHEAITGPLAVQASCDMGPGRKCILRAVLNLAYSPGSVPLTERYAAFDTVYDFASAFGRGNDRTTAYLNISACDEWNMSCVTRQSILRIDLGFKHPAVARFGDRIHDYAHGRVLLEGPGGLSLADTIGKVESIGSKVGIYPIKQSRLTATGAMLLTHYTADDHDSRNNQGRWHFWTGGKANEVMSYMSFGGGYNIALAGDTFAWWAGNQVYLRSITDSTHEQRNYPGEVAVVLDDRTAQPYFVKNGSLYHIGADSVRLLASDDSADFYHLIVSDGKALLAKRHEGGSVLRYFDGKELVPVRGVVDERNFPVRLVPILALANGWIAFAKPGTQGQAQIWLRDTSGGERQATFFSTSSTIEKLADNGDLFFLNGGRRYFRSAAGVVVDFSTAAWGTVRWESGTWYYWFANALYRLDPAILTMPTAVEPGGKERASAAVSGFRGRWVLNGSAFQLLSHPGGPVRISFLDIRGRMKGGSWSGTLEPGNHLVPLHFRGGAGSHLILLSAGAEKWRGMGMKMP